ncbi:hypothetical protein NLG97_g6280 [Lecanicillium saksenae]|uniref:Uncharacterized protein n=1 Tax=Lecanicillium saksenae TaxID=468837 RepID=A0ACC1QR77_9HYPO|nr:hypothetical protein NLG97_g6280 [Lecanicillium saksenae]
MVATLTPSDCIARRTPCTSGTIFSAAFLTASAEEDTAELAAAVSLFTERAARAWPLAMLLKLAAIFLTPRRTSRCCAEPESR